MVKKLMNIELDKPLELHLILSIWAFFMSLQVAAEETMNQHIFHICI